MTAAAEKIEKGEGRRADIFEGIVNGVDENVPVGGVESTASLIFMSLKILFVDIEGAVQRIRRFDAE